MKRMVRLDLLLAAIVLLVLFSQRSAGTEEIEGRYYSQPYSVLSANVGNAHPLDVTESALLKLQPNSEEERRVKAEIERLKPDIIILIEAFNIDQVKNLCFDRQNREYAYAIDGGVYDFIAIRKSLGEIIGGQVIQDKDRFGAGYVDIKLTEERERKARLFFVHPPSNFPKLPNLWDQREHQTHIDTFRWVCEKLEPDLPALIAGDFNNDFLRWQEQSSQMIKREIENLGLWIFNPLSVESLFISPDGSTRLSYEATQRLPSETLGERTLDWVMGKDVIPPSKVPGRKQKTDSFNTNLPNWWQGTSATDFDHKPLFGPVVFSWPADASPAAYLAAVVMDASGSMEGAKLAGAKRAANGLFGILKPDESACLVTFSRDARVEVGAVRATEENKLRLQNGVRILEAGDSTNITAGLETALNVIRDKALKTAAYLLSDGMHNVGPGPLDGNPSVARRFADTGIPVSTIAYGSGIDAYAGVDLKTLQEIALLTGGTFWWGSPQNLTQVYHKIDAHRKGRSVLISYNDLISQGKGLMYRAVIDPDITSATFFADWQGSTVDLHLVTPDNREIRPDNLRTASGVSFQKGESFCSFQVDNPTPGQWKVHLLGREINQDKEQVNLTISGESAFTANILGLQPEYRQRESISILVKAANANKVTAEIKKPGPNLKKMLDRGEIDLGALLLHALFQKQKIALYDDGRHNDLKPNDDIFGGLYQEADESGCYLVVVRCEAKGPKGEKLTRTLRESIQIGPIENRSVTLADFLGL